MKKHKSSLPSNFIKDIIYEDLKEGRYNKVHTRFPPEPNGYLHVGHAKAICINFGIAKEYNGPCNLRFDDTNPIKEEQEYIDSIEEDIRWLGFDWEDREYFASDYFEKLYDYAIKLTDTTLEQLDKQGNWPTLQKILDSAIFIAKKKDLKSNILRYQYALSRVLYHMAQYSDAIKLGENALILAEKLEDQAHQADINGHLGSVWRFEGDRKQAISYIRKAEELNLKLDNPVNRGKNLFLRAIIEHGMGHLSKARELYDLIVEMVKNE